MPLIECTFWNFVAMQILFFLLPSSFSSLSLPCFLLFPLYFLLNCHKHFFNMLLQLFKQHFLKIPFLQWIAMILLLKISLMFLAVGSGSQTLRHVTNHLTSHSALSLCWPLRESFLLNLLYWCHLFLVFFVNTKAHSFACLQRHWPSLADVEGQYGGAMTLSF